jgi:ABC-type sugar transport system permease subunit
MHKSISGFFKTIYKHRMAYLFISVPVVSMMVFLFIPMLFSFYWSFCNYSGLQPPEFVGLANYVKLFTRDKIFVQSLWNTVLYVVMGMLLGPSLGLLTAILLNQKIKFRSVFRTAYFLPVMTSMVVVSTIWLMLLNKNGIINSVLNMFGVNTINWLSNPDLALFSITVASVWQGFGFETVIFLAALQSIPPQLYEAAEIDGANHVQKFFYITLPSLKSVITFVYIYGVIGSFQTFDQMYIMTNGGPIHRTTTIVLYLYEKFRDLNLGYASAVAYVLFFILLILSFFQWKMSQSEGEAV